MAERCDADGLVRVPRARDDGEPVSSLDGLDECLSDRLVVVGDQHADPVVTLPGDGAGAMPVRGRFRRWSGTCTIVDPNQRRRMSVPRGTLRRRSTALIDPASSATTVIHPRRKHTASADARSLAPTFS